MWQSQQLDAFNGALFQKIGLLIKQAIEQGTLVAGERLPSERILAQKLHVNRSTVTHALAILAEQGVVIRKHGSGTYINEQKWRVQNQPIINWRLPTNFHQNKSQYQQKVHNIKQQTSDYYDLSNSDLPSSLIPPLSLPAMTTDELIVHEKNSAILQQGLPSLKLHIANYMQQQFAMQVDYDEILITSGTAQSLFLISQGLLRPGDKIAMESRSYFYSLSLFQAAGLRIYPIKTDQHGMCIDDLKRITQQNNIKMIFINPVFQNPTGLTMSMSRKQSILAFCQQQCIGIIEDDAYSALYFDEPSIAFPIKKLDQYKQVIYLGSLSKYIGRNIRVGWMIAPKPIINKLAEVRQHIDFGISIVPQLLANDYLQNHYQTHQQLLRNELKQRALKLMNWLNRYYRRQITYQPPQGGFHLYASLAGLTSKQQTDFLTHWLNNKILVAKGDNFGDDASNIRLSYGHIEGDLPLLGDDGMIK